MRFSFWKIPFPSNIEKNWYPANTDLPPTAHKKILTKNTQPRNGLPINNHWAQYDNSLNSLQSHLMQLIFGFYHLITYWHNIYFQAALFKKRNHSLNIYQYKFGTSLLYSIINIVILAMRTLNHFYFVSMVFSGLSFHNWALGFFGKFPTKKKN
jgi:hypothetical protein